MLSRLFLRYSARFTQTSAAQIPLIEPVEPVIFLAPREFNLSEMSPHNIVKELDRYIIGQSDAKKAVAVALRNRYRRAKLTEPMKSEVIPKNILMVGPTGVGKTEIARRLAKLCDAPFVKVEATKYTEVGFHGKDVDDIIKDLVEVSIKLVKNRRRKAAKVSVESVVNEKILDSLLGNDRSVAAPSGTSIISLDNFGFRNKVRALLLEGKLENTHITITIEEPVDNNPFKELGAKATGIAIDKAILGLGNILTLKGGKLSRGETRMEKIVTVAEARTIFTEQAIEKSIQDEDLGKEAIKLAEQEGIVVIDEIDKICNPKHMRDGKDASSEGVQRDLLPLVEGCTVTTKYGNIETNHILFICSGAFSACKPSDMLAELQGRLPIRVNLKPLSEGDLVRILTEPEFNITRQQVELMKTENVHVKFQENGISEIAKVSAAMNSAMENIGARRLHTVVEKLMEDISYDVPAPDTEIIIDHDYVKKRVSDMVKHADLSKYVI